MCTGTICERVECLQNLPPSTQTLRCLSQFLRDLFHHRSRQGVYLPQPIGSAKTYSSGDRPTPTRGPVALSFRLRHQRLSYTAETGPPPEQCTWRGRSTATASNSAGLSSPVELLPIAAFFAESGQGLVVCRETHSRQTHFSNLFFHDMIHSFGQKLHHTQRRRLSSH